MKVVCISNDRHYNITVGKVYEVEEFFSIDSGYYQIRNDSGNIFGYEVKHFITLKEYRRRKLDSIQT